ncbi:MAG: NAD(P)/FAD-dependent oxidoreductase [Eubacterium sp.]
MYDIAIIGCGITGASTAYYLSRYKLKCIIIEKDNDVCNATTKANSAIIHAGYDPKPETLMARLNVRGNILAKEICQRLNVSYKQIGSLVTAFSEDEVKTLGILKERGEKNGVEGLEIISAKRLREIEPNISEKALGALYAPSAAVVDPWDYGLAMAEVAVKNGCELMLNSEVTGIDKTEAGWKIETANAEIEAKYVINAAGVFADKIHNMVAEPCYEIRPCAGEYYLLDKSEGKRVNHVIFQCPGIEGKGVLVSPTVHGNLIVGPNAENRYDEPENVKCTSKGLNEVREKAVKSVPSISFRENIRNFTGIRANSNIDDFIIQESAEHFIDAGGIKSPGLSAAPAIAEYIVELIKESGLELTEKESFDDTRSRVRFSLLSPEEKNELIKKRPEYGRVICRCETITQGEIIDALNCNIPPCSIDGIKRRTGAGMGRCQGGFCGPRILELIAKHTGKSPSDVLQDKNGSYILIGETKSENK